MVTHITVTGKRVQFAGRLGNRALKRIVNIRGTKIKP
jgi:hypothetical protein